MWIFFRTFVPDYCYTYETQFIFPSFSCPMRHCTACSCVQVRRAGRPRTGEISGSIIMSDNSGMNGVEVALQAADGTTLVPLTGNPSPVTGNPSPLQDHRGRPCGHHTEQRTV